MMPPYLEVENPVEYVLYAVALRYPELFREGEQFIGRMLANDQDAMRRVRALVQISAATHA